MNGYIIAGIILVGIGTFLMSYGGVVQSRKDAVATSQASEKKLEEISKDLSFLKGKPKSELSSDALNKVESDLTKWAKAFASEKQRKKLQVEKQVEEHKSSVEHTNDLIRDYFSYFTSLIRVSLESYSKESGEAIALDLPNIMGNIFATPENGYTGRVNFSSNTSWVIRTHYDDQVPSLAGPTFLISLVKAKANGNSYQEYGELMIRFSKDAQTYFRRLQRDFLLAVPEHSSNKPIANFEDDIRNVIMALIEFQLSQK